MKLDDRTTFVQLDPTVKALERLGWKHIEKARGHAFIKFTEDVPQFFVLPKNFPIPRQAIMETLGRIPGISLIAFFTEYQAQLSPSE